MVAIGVIPGGLARRGCILAVRFRSDKRLDGILPEFGRLRRRLDEAPGRRPRDRDVWQDPGDQFGREPGNVVQVEQAAIRSGRYQTRGDFTIDPGQLVELVDGRAVEVDEVGTGGHG